MGNERGCSKNKRHRRLIKAFKELFQIILLLFNFPSGHPILDTTQVSSWFSGLTLFCNSCRSCSFLFLLSLLLPSLILLQRFIVCGVTGDTGWGWADWSIREAWLKFHEIKRARYWVGDISVIEWRTSQAMLTQAKEFTNSYYGIRQTSIACF